VLTRRQIRKGVHAALAFWRPITGLDRWTLACRWRAVPDRDDVPAGFTCTPEYTDGELYLNMDLLAPSYYASTQAHLSYLILHELCHGLNGEVVEQVAPDARSEPFRKAMERNTSMIARAVWVAKFGTEPPE
jgi:hypothetical protein